MSRTLLYTRRKASWLLLAVTAVLICGCAAMDSAAPVMERSPNPAPITERSPTAPTTVRAEPAAKPTPTVAQSAATARAATAAPSTPKTQPAPAPKVEEPTIKPYREGDWRPEYYVVKKGDTLYSIALDYGHDYRELAAWNRLEDPGLIKIDQRLRLFPPDTAGAVTTLQPVPLPAEAAVPVKTEPKARKLPYSEQALAQMQGSAPKPAAATVPTVATTTVPLVPKPVAVTAASPMAKETGRDVKLVWEWPAQGKLIYNFGEGPNQKGVGIEGRPGQPVTASAPGKVVYSGSGLRGYGKLIIIKHNTAYLSVYAHNRQILVKEGQSVAKGQKIAEMGDTDSDRVALHFEIRRLGKPIDPLQYLPERAS